MMRFYNIFNIDLVKAKTGKRLKWWEVWVNNIANFVAFIFGLGIIVGVCSFFFWINYKFR